ncbi:MAG: hypothetical protein JWL60_1013 [Gemmatimonadetes bacterium]|jgi:iron complex outermembrane receptor protein|nr:hypothetical protein [Gemmatimonadota bacterium]
MLRALSLSILLSAAPVASLAAQRPAVPIDTVRVVTRAAPSAAATRSVEVVTREDIDRRASRSLAELLAFALGADVQTRSPAQADLSLRGSTFNQVVVLVDGVRVSDVQSGHYALDLAVPAAMIERIEILRGGGSALYGSDAVGGIVNIVTRRDGAGTSFAARGGSFGTAAASAVVFGQGAGLSLRAGADVDRADGHRPGTDHRVVQLRLGAERDTRAGRVVADLGQGVRRFGAADFYSPFPSEETTRSSTAAVRLVPASDARRSVAGSLHLRRHGDLFTLKRDDPAFYQNRHVSVEGGGELTARATFGPRLVTAVGVDALEARLRSARLGDHAQTRVGTFGQVTLEAAHRITVDAALRHDWLSDVDGFLSPSVGLALPLASTVRLRASSSRGFRAATWTERFYADPANVADSTLGVERFVSHEVGVRVLPAPWLLADVAWFQRHARGLIDWARPAGAPATTPWRTRNVASAVYRGVEGMLRVPSLLGTDVTVRASTLRLDSSVEPGTIGKYALRPLTHSMGATVTAPLRALGTLTVDAVHARRTGEAAYLHLNSRLVVPVGGLRLSVEGVNLAGAGYLDGAGKAVAGRSLFGGVSWTAP